MLVRALIATVLFATAVTDAFAATCDTDTPFNAPPVKDLSTVSHIVPLGNLNPAYGHTIPARHIYVYPKTGTSLEVQSPGDVELVAAVFHPLGSDPRNAAQKEDEWELHLQPCAGVTLYYNHIVDLRPDLRDAILKVPPVAVYGADARPVSINLMVGAPIGKAATFDIGLVDTRKPALSFANPARYAANVGALLETLKLSGNETAKQVIPRIIPQALYSRCALDYFASGLRQTMYAMLAGSDGTIKAKGRPLCHSNMQDVSGSAQGNWWSGQSAVNAFLNDDMALSLSNSNVDPSVPLFSLNGKTPNDVQAGVYGFVVPPSLLAAAMKPVNRRFSDVKDLNIQCYAGLAPASGGTTLNVVVLLQLDQYRSATPNRLRIEFIHDKKSCSEIKTPWAFGPAATLLYR